MALTTVPASLSATALTLTTAAQPNITSVGTLTGLTVSGNIAGTLTTAAQTNITSLGTLTTLTVDDITINGSTISDAADFLLDVGGDISFDADGGDIRLLDGGTQFGKFTRDGGDFLISSSENDKDIKFAGADGGANITALTLDMSNAGAATFNSTVTANAGVIVDNITIDGQEIDVSSGNFTLDVAGNIVLDSDTGVLQVQDGGTVFYQLAKSSDNVRLTSFIQDGDMEFRGNDGGSYFTALTLDMSAAGAAEFTGDVGIKQAPSGNFPLEITKVGGDAININSAADFSGIRMTDNSHSYAIRNAVNKFFIYDVTNTTQRVTLDDSGNFGIGTASPNGNGQLTINSASNTSPQIVFTENNTAKWLIGHRHEDDRFRFYDLANSAERLTIDSSGRLKIGTSSYANSQYYANTAVIHAANEGGLTIANSATSHGSYIMFADGVSSGSEQYAGYIEYNHNVDRMRLKSNGDFLVYGVSLGADALAVKSAGNVGIGTTSPKRMLQVGNNSQAIAALSLQSTTTGLSRIYMGDNDSTAAEYRGMISYVHSDDDMQFWTSAEERMRIHSDGKVDIKNAGTDKIVRFINTGSGTQGVTIGTTTSNSAGTGVHIGHQGTKAFIHPYNYTAGAYQQMEIACSDFVLKVNGSASGMTMDSSSNAIFYGDVTINDANDRLKQNGVAREAKGGYIQGNQTVSYTINHTAQSTFHVRCGFNHYGLLSYGCVLDQIFANGPGGMTSATATISTTTGPGGGWSVSRVDGSNVTISKSAGNYAGGGYYYIIVEGANL